MLTTLTGKQIRIKRVENDMKLTELAAKLGVSVPWMSLVENGKENGEPLRMKATLYFHNLENYGEE